MKGLMVTAAVLALATLGNGTATGAESRPLLTFGLITDTHVCDKADQAEVITVNATARYYTGGLAKIEAFAQAMSHAGAAFVAELGDFIDNPADPKLGREQKKAAALGYAQAAEAKLAGFAGARYHVFGNHDTDQLSKEDFVAQLGQGILGQGGAQAGGPFYYSWTVNGVHVIVLDASYKVDGNGYSGEPGTAGAGYTWDDSNVPAAELAWLEADLEANPQPTIVLTHQLVSPLELVDPTFDPKHAIKQAPQLRALLEHSGHVLAVFSGHYHDGGFQRVNGINYVVLQANAAYGNDVAYHNQYALVEVEQRSERGYRVNVLGHGLQKSYILSADVR